VSILMSPFVVTGATLIATIAGSVETAAALPPKPKAASFVAAAGASPAPLAAATASTGAQVALTFDDLPGHGPLPAGTSRVEIAKSLIAALKAAGATSVYGLLNAKLLAEGPEMMQVLELWRNAGFLLGNHTFSHMDLNANTPAAFEEDIRADEPTLRVLMGDRDWHWLRFPYLRAGDTPEKREAVAAFLRENGYKVAEVTLSFDDWAYSDPYARCVARSDQQAIDWLKQSYLARASARIGPALAASRRVYGREIPFVLLCHAGAFQAQTLPALLDLLKQRGFTFLGLGQAESDPAYASERDLAQGALPSRLPELRAAEQSAVPADDTFDRLNALCR
jgi:peptidoglycan-N-acetylglucosamine deacetylase